MMTVRIADTPLTPPATEPVTVEECEVDIRADGSEFSSSLPSIIAAARFMCEGAINRKLITQTWRVSAESWPVDERIGGLTPFQSASITYWNGTSWVSYDSNSWALVDENGRLRLWPAYGSNFPSLGNLAGPRVRIDVTCGYGTAADVPANLKMWIRAHVAAMIRSPDAHGDNRKMVKLEHLDRLLDSERVYV